MGGWQAVRKRQQTGKGNIGDLHTCRTSLKPCSAPSYAFHSVPLTTDQPTHHLDSHQLDSPRIRGLPERRRVPLKLVPWKASQLARLTTTLAKTLTWQVSRT